MSYIGKSESEIIEGCKKEDREAQNALYRLFYGKMNAASYRYTGSYDDSKDIVHDTFIHVFKKINSFNGNGSIEGWIRRIVVNRTVDFMTKKNKRHVKVSEEENTILKNKHDYNEYKNDLSNQDAVESIYTAGLTKEEIKSAIDLLKEEYKVVFNLNVVDGFSHKNISEVLTISEELSRIRLKRARVALQSILIGMAEKKKKQNLTNYPNE